VLAARPCRSIFGFGSHPAEVPKELDSQLDAIWSATAKRRGLFADFGPVVEIAVEVVIEHHGSQLLLGWVLDRRHIRCAAELSATIDVDEYDYTQPG
jgi:hypothetical protein